MRGRWASAALGAGIARHRAESQADAQMQQQAASYQREIDQLKAAQSQQSQTQQPSGQEDVTLKLKKLADLKQQGVLTDEEFQKLKTDLLAKL